MRLNQFLAHATGLSRRTADEAISSGRVQVNGGVARLGQAIEPTDAVTLDGQPVAAQTNYTYVLLHKPVGYVCSRRAQGENPTIYDLLPPQYHNLRSAGRLDADSSGVLLLTDDGQLIHELTHPRYAKQKSYELELDRTLQSGDDTQIEQGVELEDGLSSLQLEGEGKHWRVLMHEGRNRQIRRTFGALGYNVTKLHRTNFGPYQLGQLRSGEWHIIDKQ